MTRDHSGCSRGAEEGVVGTVAGRESTSVCAHAVSQGFGVGASG